MHRKGKAAKRAQITLEFLIAYSLVLLIFLIIFALIATQRASTLASQDYSSMQLLSQTVSTAIDTALASGNGYSTTLNLPSAISTVPYNLSISSTGVVIASMQIGKETVSAQAFSNARDLVVNGTVISTGNAITLYSLPSYKGTIYLANSKGAIYVDEQPVSALSLEGSLEANVSFDGEAASFNGQNSYVEVPTTKNLPLGSSVGSTFAWIQISAYPTSSVAEIEDYGVPSGGEGRGMYITTTGSLCFTGWADDWCSPFTIPLNQWVFVGYNYYGGTSVAVYYNSKNASGSIGSTLNTIAGINLIAKRLDDAAPYLSGQVANVQIYNTSLSANEIQALYQEGIGGAPISNAGLVGWWPLNGNTNDYSGNGNNGIPNEVSYSSVSQITARVKNANGANASGDLVGFTSTYGNFSSSGKMDFATYANSSGIATAILEANPVNPTIANVTVTAFNGNSTVTANMVGWWPLNMGSGNSAYDLSTNYNNGNFSNYAWSSLSNSTNFAVAAFPGDLGGVSGNSAEDGFVTVNNTNIYSIPANRTFTVVSWIYYKGATSNHCQGIFGDWPDPGPGFQLLGYGCSMLIINGSSVNWPAGTSSFPKGTWEMVSAEYTARTGIAAVYLNSTLFATQQLPTSLSLLEKSPYYIGDDAWQTTGYDTFNGSIANVQLYSSFLTPQQINILYKEGINGVPLSNAGLVGWWPLNGNTNDYSGNGNNGKINYNVSFVNQRLSVPYNYSVASFNGQNSYIIANVINLPTGNNERTVVAWFNVPVEPPSGDQTSLFAYGTANNCDQTFWVSVSGTGATCDNGQIFIDNWCTCQAFPGLTTLNLNSWYFVAFEYNGTYQIGYLGNNGGNLVKVDQPESISTGSSPFYIGYWIVRNYFDGSIANVQIYNTALSSSKIQQLYLQGLPQYKRLTIQLG